MTTSKTQDRGCFRAAGVLVALLTIGAAVSVQEAMAQETSTRKPSNSKTDTERPTASLQIGKEARAAIDAARKFLADIKGKKGADRKAIQSRAAAAFDDVATRFAAEPASVARASFEAAELWGLVGDNSKAEAGYRRAMQSDPARFKERCLFELAHIARRQKAYPDAIQLYKQVVEMDTGTNRHHDAGIWVGRCFEAMGKRPEAESAYRSFLTKTTKARRCIEICNRLANLLIKAGRLDDAAQAIEQAAAAVRTDQAGDSKQTAAVQSALENMSARRALQRARDKKNKVPQDAADIEKSRRQ